MSIDVIGILKRILQNNLRLIDFGKEGVFSDTLVQFIQIMHK